MSHSTRPIGAPLSLALSCVGSMLIPVPAAAEAQPDPQQAGGAAAEPRSLGGVTVSGTAIDDQEGLTLESPKRTRTVRDTPQTITVVTNQQIQQQNLLTLRDVLSTVPGITFGAGEGGSGYGDSINFRGYSANTDITIDGVRDSAQYSRTDPFNLDQIEVTNGANSVVAGSGSVGGSINLVTKHPQAKDSTNIGVGAGTADYWRGTADVNRLVGSDIAVRLNAMVHRNDVPGRDVENYKRWGLAPAVTFGITSPTRLTLQYLHQEDTNIPQYGIPYFQNAFNNGPVPGVDRSDYFGYRNIDEQKDNVDQATATFNHDFTDTISVRNLARWQDVTQFSLVDPPQGTYCLTGGITPTGTACTYPGYYLPSGPRGNTRKSRNQLLYDQADLNAVVKTGAIEHTIDFGASASKEKYTLSSGSSERNADGTVAYAAYPLMKITDPNHVVAGPAGQVYGSNLYTGALNYIETARQAGELQDYAAYLFDTAKLGKFELNGGVRVERSTGWYRADTVSAVTPTLGQVTRGTVFHNRDTLFSYRVGLVYKPIEPVSLYVAYGNSQTPSKTSVNGSCDATSCNVDPETAKNYEVGAKAQLFDGGLLVTAAAFRNERDKYKVASNDPTLPDQQLNGRSRVNGVALGATGKITPAWTITANYTYLSGKLLHSVSTYCLTHPGTTCANSAANPDPGRGSQLANTPKNSGSLFTTYKLPFGLTVGYGATYQGSFAFAAPTLAAPIVFHSKDYLVHNFYLAYDFSRRLSAQLNVKNFTDKLYYTRIRNNGWATPGDGRSAVLALTYHY